MESKYSQRKVSIFELYAARMWNLLNEGKSFFVIFSFFIIFLFFFINSYSFYRLIIAMLATLPLWAVFIRYDFPLKYRSFLWGLLIINLLMFHYLDFTALLLMLILYFLFTIILWGSIYYHLRIGIPITNFTRFWKLVLENTDSTSGNSMEQIPKVTIMVTTVLMITGNGIGSTIPKLALFTAISLFLGILSNYLFFQKVVKKETGTKTKIVNSSKKLTNRVIVIVIDGCRQDKLIEANTPTIDNLEKNGVTCTQMRTVYPDRTVVCFSSMFTGAPKEKHGIKSNLVIKSLFGKEGLKCESVFDVIKKNGMRGRMIGIAHLVDAFGEYVKTISALHPNDTVDKFIMENAREVIQKENPELLVVQLISTDQTGHARGTSYPEYIKKIEDCDLLIKEFVNWLKKRNLLKDTTLIVMADHGQSIRGIGGHGHWDTGEKYVPFIMWGKPIKKGLKIEKPKRILDVAPTISYLLGIEPPKDSIGETIAEAIR